MNKEAVRHGHLGGRKALGDGTAAVDAARTGRVPEGPGVGEDILGGC